MQTNFSEDTKAFLETSGKAATTCELTHCLLSETKKLGVDQVLYLEFQMLGGFLIPTQAKGSVAEKFTNRYLRDSLYKIDPFIHEASLNTRPFGWHELLSKQSSNKDASVFYGICREYDMLDGFVVPARTPNSKMSMVSYMASGELKSAAYDHLHQLAIYYGLAIRRLLNPPEHEPNKGLLTPRQLECVKWIAKGKSDWEIATILGLSEATINRHVELAKERLGVHTRVQVVVEALKAGCLDLGLKPGLALPG